MKNYNEKNNYDDMEIEVKNSNLFGLSALSQHATKFVDSAIADYVNSDKSIDPDTKLMIAQNLSLAAISTALILLLRSREFERRNLGSIFNPNSSGGFSGGEL